MSPMSDARGPLRRALERGWIRAEDVDSGRSLEELLPADRIAELEAREMASRLLAGGPLGGASLVEDPPAVIGRFEVLGLAGSGGMGRVYLARDPRLRRTVAIKVLDRSGPALFERFRREASILAGLRHPNLVTVHEAGLHEERPFYVMEYVGERTLADARPPLREAIDILARVAEGCHAAHERGVVHRDLKPSNVLLLDDRPVVADFGLAHVTGELLTRTGETFGTIHYMSPEQVRGEEVDRRADVWSIGVMLYEVLTGRRPFEGRTPAEVGRAILEASPVPPRQLESSAPRALERIALAALAGDRARRPATALELARRLDRWRTAGGRSLLQGPARWALALTLVGLGVAILLVHHARRGPVEEAPVHADPGPAFLAWLDEAERDLASAEPPGSARLASVIEGRLETPGLDPQAVARGLLLAARARRAAGLDGAAALDLERALATGPGPLAGECHLALAWIEWREASYAQARHGRPRSREVRSRTLDRLRRARDAGFPRPDRLELAERLIALLEDPRGVGAPPDSLPEAERSLVEGDLRLLSQRAPDALRAYEHSLEDPACPEAWSRAAIAHLILAREHEDPSERRRRRERAIEAALRAVEVRPLDDTGYRIFAFACREGFAGGPAEALAGGAPGLPGSWESILEASVASAPGAWAPRVSLGCAQLLDAATRVALGEDGPEAFERAERTLAEPSLGQESDGRVARAILHSVRAAWRRSRDPEGARRDVEEALRQLDRVPGSDRRALEVDAWREIATSIKDEGG